MDDFKLSKTIRKIVRNQKPVHDVINSSAKKMTTNMYIIKSLVCRLFNINKRIYNNKIFIVVAIFDTVLHNLRRFKTILLQTARNSF